MDFFNFNKASYSFGDVSVSKYLNKSFDISLYGSYGEHVFYKKPLEKLKARNTYGDLTLRCKIIQKKTKLVPFVFVGIGARNLDAVKNTSGKYNVNSGMDLVIQAGLGLDYRLTSAIA